MKTKSYRGNKTLAHDVAKGVAARARKLLITGGTSGHTSATKTPPGPVYTHQTLKSVANGRQPDKGVALYRQLAFTIDV